MRFPLEKSPILAMSAAYAAGAGEIGPWQRMMAAWLNPATQSRHRHLGWRQRLAAWIRSLPLVQSFQGTPPPALTPVILAAAQAAVVEENLLRALPWFQASSGGVKGAAEMLASVSDDGLRFAALMASWCQAGARAVLPKLPALATPADHVLAFWIFEDVAMLLAQHHLRRPGMKLARRPAGGLRRPVVLEALVGLAFPARRDALNAIGALALASPLAMLVYADTLRTFRVTTPEAAAPFRAVVCPGACGAPGWQRVWISLVAQSLAAALEAPAPSAEELAAVEVEKAAAKQENFAFLRRWRHLAGRDLGPGTLQEERFDRLRSVATILGQAGLGGQYFKGWLWTLQIRHWLATHEALLIEGWQKSKGDARAMFEPSAPVVLGWVRSVLGFDPKRLASRPADQWNRAAISESLFAVGALSSRDDLAKLTEAAGVTATEAAGLVHQLEMPTIMPFTFITSTDFATRCKGWLMGELLNCFDEALRDLAPKPTETEEQTHTTYEA